jgi:hypothetical protein
MILVLGENLSGSGIRTRHIIGFEYFIRQPGFGLPEQPVGASAGRELFAAVLRQNFGFD